MEEINVHVYDNGFQNTVYNRPEIPLYLVKGNLSLFNYRFKPHWHRDFEIIRMIDGHMKYNIDGAIIELQKNDVLFVNSNRMHFGFSKTKTECHYICIVFDYHMLNTNAYIMKNYISKIAEDESHPFLIIKKNHNLVSTIDDLYSIRNNPSYDLKCQALLFETFSEIFEAYKKAPNIKTNRADYAKTKEMIHFITLNYQQKITLGDIAKAGNVSKNTCINHFNEIFGQPPIDYLISFRLDQSAELLKNTNMSITEIANAIGFTNASYYIERFKRQYKTTPNHFRKNALQTATSK